MKNLFLILGMHRSATSLTAGILSSYGIYTGQEEDLWEADINNQAGYFENKYVVLLNDKILYEHCLNWATIPKKINTIKNTKYTNEIDDIIKNMLEKSSNNQDILIKDPRMCLLEPIWKLEFIKFGLTENIIVVFRHPFEVAKSLQIRDNINFVYALKLWFYYNFNILNYVSNTDAKVLVLNHENYFLTKDQQIRTLEKFINYPKENNDAKKFIDYNLRHNSVQNLKLSLNVELEQMILELYTFFLVLATNKEIVITKKHLKKYETYMQKLICTSYECNQEDIFPQCIQNSIGREKKLWCIYQLKNNTYFLIEKFSDYFTNHKIIKLFLYGNGTITEALLPVLYKAGIIIEKIFDIKYKEDLHTLHNIPQESYIINTVVNYNDNINNYLIKYFKKNYIIDIYILLNKFLGL